MYFSLSNHINQNSSFTIVSYILACKINKSPFWLRMVYGIVSFCGVLVFEMFVQLAIVFSEYFRRNEWNSYSLKGDLSRVLNRMIKRENTVGPSPQSVLRIPQTCVCLCRDIKTLCTTESHVSCRPSLPLRCLLEFLNISLKCHMLE